MLFLHLDCQFYRGDRPCKFNRLCQGCPHYEPMGPRWLIVKLGALGDVLRTGCLMPGLKKMDEPPFVTWVTAPEAVPLVQRIPGVNRVLPFTWETAMALEQERFDVLVCLDKEPAPCALASRVQAENRLGVTLTRSGTVKPVNDEASYYFRLGLDDEEKFHRNEKSYPQLVYEALGMVYMGQRYELQLTGEDRRAADEILGALNIPAGKKLIGLNPGAGTRFANKAWPEASYVELIARMGALHPDAAFLLLGGPDEIPLLGRIAAAAQGDVYVAGGYSAIGTSAAIIERCAVVVAGDTLAMHMAVALGRRVVAIFGPTCHQEIDLFGRGEKIVTTIGCSPCYKKTCDITPTCQDEIGVEAVASAVEAQLAAEMQEATA